MAHFNISMHIVRYQPSGIIFYCDSLWSLLFFSLIRLRPASKLFPYTTLFRSRVVERDVVRHQRAAAEHLDDVTDDVAELRLVLQHGGGQPVHVGGAGVHPGVEQADHGLLDAPVCVEAERGNADDPRLTRPKPRGLDVDNGPTPARLAGRPPPGHPVHELRMARRTDITWLLRPRVANALNRRGRPTAPGAKRRAGDRLKPRGRPTAPGAKRRAGDRP